MDTFAINQGILNRACEGNTFLLGRWWEHGKKEICERCEGTGEVPVTWPVFRLHLEGIFHIMPPGKKRFCTLYQEYRHWIREGTIPCSECQ